MLRRAGHSACVAEEYVFTMRLRRAMIRYFLGDCPQMGYSNISRNRL
jgi:hypothetical protein